MIYERIEVARLGILREFLDKASAGELQPDTANEMGQLIDRLIEAKHQSLIPAAQMVVKNAGLDPTKTSVMGKDGKIDTLDNVAKQSNKATTQISNTPPPGATGKAKGSDGKMHWTDGQNDLGVAP